MGGLKTILLSLTVCVGLHSPAASLDAQDVLLQRFAHCAGRLSALMEHQWMFDGPASEHTKHARAQMIDLIDAVMAPGQGRAALNWRIEAKLAYAALLQRAKFAEAPKNRAWAKRTAQRLLQDCQGMLLS